MSSKLKWFELYSGDEGQIGWKVQNSGHLSWLKAQWHGGPEMTTTNPAAMNMFVQDVERAYSLDQESKRAGKRKRFLGSLSNGPSTGGSGAKPGSSLSSFQPSEKQVVGGDQRTRSLSWLGQDEINTLVQNAEKKS